MAITSTVNNSRMWRIWHSTTYMIGGVTYFLGSLILYTIFAEVFDNTVISGFLYTIGSMSFLAADITQWLHFQPAARCKESARWCEYWQLSVQRFISACGAAIYLIGSIMFIPALNQTINGLHAFIVGSTIVSFSLTFKIYRNASLQSGLGYCGNLQSNLNGFLADLFGVLSALMFLLGSVLFLDSDSQFATTIFTIGGIFFYLSAHFLIKKYFYNVKPKQIQSSDNYIELIENFQRIK